jgi:mannose-1-phosphate guanylyltransferase
VWDIQAVILAGGEGTRLPVDPERPGSRSCPRDFRPFLHRLQRSRAAATAHQQMIMSCGLAERRAVLARFAPWIRPRCVEEPELRGTAGALKLASHMLRRSASMLNGMVLTDIDPASDRPARGDWREGYARWRPSPIRARLRQACGRRAPAR